MKSLNGLKGYVQGKASAVFTPSEESTETDSKEKESESDEMLSTSYWFGNGETEPPPDPWLPALVSSYIFKVIYICV